MSEESNSFIDAITESEKNVPFQREEMPADHEQKIQEFMDWCIKNEYMVYAIIGARDNQKVCINGQVGALNYSVCKACLSDDNFLNITATALTMTSSILEEIDNADRSKLN